MGKGSWSQLEQEEADETGATANFGKYHSLPKEFRENSTAPLPGGNNAGLRLKPRQVFQGKIWFYSKYIVNLPYIYCRGKKYHYRTRPICGALLSSIGIGRAFRQGRSRRFFSTQEPVPVVYASRQRLCSSEDESHSQ